MTHTMERSPWRIFVTHISAGINTKTDLSSHLRRSKRRPRKQRINQFGRKEWYWNDKRFVRRRKSYDRTIDQTGPINEIMRSRRALMVHFHQVICIQIPGWSNMRLLR
jgi:hypothetical protein